MHKPVKSIWSLSLRQLICLLCAICLTVGCKKTPVPQPVYVTAKIVSLEEDVDNKSGKVRDNVNETVYLALLEVVEPEELKGEPIWVYQKIHKLGENPNRLRVNNTLVFTIDPRKMGDDQMCTTEDLLGMQVKPR